MDNELYQAVREGRVPLRIELEQTPNGQWEASYDGFGVEVKVVDDSQTYAQSQAISQVMDKIRDNKFQVRVA